MGQPRRQTNADPQEHPANPEDAAARHPTDDDEREERRRDEAVDEASAESFPSSDPPAW